MNELKMQTLLLGLTDLGITGINVYYAGGGDDGAIENICYSKEPNIDFDEIMNIDIYGDSYNLETLNSSIFSQLQDFAQSHILDDIEDWWNNDGGYGYLCIKVPSGEYKVFNMINVMNIEEFEHEGGLIDKTLE
jgi:hypothetical protein